MQLNEFQYQAGLEKLDALRANFGLDRRQMAELLINISDLKNFYNWVNASTFLCLYLDKN